MVNHEVEDNNDSTSSVPDATDSGSDSESAPQDNDEGTHAPDGKDSGAETKPEIDIEGAKKHILKEAVDPIADKVIERITTDKETMEMIDAWNKLSKQEQRDTMMLDESMIADFIKSHIPVYNFYQIWRKISAAKQKAYVYYGVLPFPETEIRKIEDDASFKDKTAAFFLKAAGFFIPQLEVLNGPMAVYIGSSEFNKQLARGVRARVAEKMAPMEVANNTENFEDEVANNTEHFEDEETSAAGIKKAE